MAIFNSLTFDGQNSLDNGVFITAESSYDAPERDIEEIEIAGRNGAFLLDKGRWKNIEVTYKAGAFGSNQTEFASKIRDFRNLMASRIGYKRLTDTYNPNEFRLGTFKDAFEVKPESANRHGEFGLIFNCKPQRYLTNGETEITVSSGDTITNPTPYDASPLLEVEGYGTMTINGYTVDLRDAVMGYVELSSVKNVATSSFNEQFPNVYLDGDTITFNGATINWRLTPRSGYTFTSATCATVGTSIASTTVQGTSSSAISLRTVFPLFTMTAGANTTQSHEVQVTMQGKQGSSVVSGRWTMEFRFTYTGSSRRFSFGSTVTQISNMAYVAYDTSQFGAVSVYSSVNLLGHPTFIDCDLGEVYKTENDKVISLNRYVDLGSDLPKLSTGANTVTFDNTVTSFKIIPRWWIL